MIYGNVMTYKYEDDKVDESGNSLLDEQGNPLTETKEITLVFNLVTLIKYKNYTGRDFLTDFLSMGEKTVKSAQKMGFDKETVEKLNRGEETTFEDFKNTDFESINADIIDIDFFVNTMGAMIAANDPHSTRDFYDIIGEVPIMLLFDPDFIKELMSLISFGLKKNKSAFKKIFSPKM